jgi:hypothetical protein
MIVDGDSAPQNLTGELHSRGRQVYVIGHLIGQNSESPLSGGMLCEVGFISF